MRKLEGIGGAITDGRGAVKRLLYLAALFVLVFLIFAPAALAQSGSLESQGITQPCPFQLDRFPEGTVCGEGGAYINPDGTAAQPVAEDAAEGTNPVVDPGDNVDPDTGEVVGDDTPDCASPEDVLESGLCRTPEAAPPGTAPGGGADGVIACEDFEDQGQAQQALGRGLQGDPAYDPEVLDDDADGIACEELPTATDPLAPDLGDEAGEDGEITCEDFEDQGQAQEALGRVLRGDPAADAEDLDPDGDGIACEDLPTVTDPNAPGTRTGEEITDGDDDAEGETTRRERRERTGGERTGGEGTGGGAEEQPADDGGDSGGGSDGGNGSSGNDGEGGAASQGGVTGAVSDGFGSVLGGRLPNTGGGWAVLLVAGAALIGGGAFLVRRFSSSA